MIQVSAPALLGNEETYVLEVLRSGQLSQGPFVRRLESAFADFCGTRFALACSSGTAALHLAMRALGVCPGQAVIVPALTYVATANAVSYCGGTVVLCDIDPATWNISPMDLERAISVARQAGLQPVGIVPVHMYGVPAEMRELESIADNHRMWLVEDAAQAHGATYYGARAGALGKLGAFSFYGNKVLSCGEGGILTTSDEGMDRLVRLFRGQGMDAERRYFHSVIGFNYRMTEMQAAVALAQLESHRAHTVIRSSIVQTYRETLTGHVVFQSVPTHCTSSNWLATVLMPEAVDRSFVESRLAFLGVETRPTFIPLAELPPYRTQALGHAQHVAMRALSLPTHSNLSKEDVFYICRSLLAVLAEASARMI